MGDPNDPSTTDAVSKEDKAELRDASSHTFYITNAQARLKLVAKNERQMDQFIASIERMAKRTIWGGENRFGSFAPIRLNVACQWLVDGVRARVFLVVKTCRIGRTARLLLELESCDSVGEGEDLVRIALLNCAFVSLLTSLSIHDWWLSPELVRCLPTLDCMSLLG